MKRTNSGLLLSLAAFLLGFWGCNNQASQSLLNLLPDPTVLDGSNPDQPNRPQNDTVGGTTSPGGTQGGEPAEPGPLPVFPGAEGFGAYGFGGRGDPQLGQTPQILFVTTLDDAQLDPNTMQYVAVPGSLRAAVETPGPRFVIFKVGGAINLVTPLEINHPYITIAGQTAPQPGIALGHHGLVIATHNVVVRHLRFRPYIDEAAGEEPGSHNRDNLLISKRDWQVQNPETDAVNNVVIDHCSFSWSIDETVDIYDWVRDVTLQWCIFAEGSLYGHGQGPQGYGILGSHPPDTACPQDYTRLSIHHCLFAHNSNRNPRIGIGDVVDFRNNVIYNWTETATQFVSDVRVNFVGNYLFQGLDTSTISQRASAGIEVSKPMEAAGTPRIYVEDNFGMRRTSSQQAEWDIGAYYVIRNNGLLCHPGSTFCYYDVQPGTDGGLYYMAEPADAPPVTTHAAAVARDLVLQHAGASKGGRDDVDLDMLSEISYVSTQRPFQNTDPNYDVTTDPNLRRLGAHHGDEDTVVLFKPVHAANSYCTPRTRRVLPGESVYDAQLAYLLGRNCTFTDGLTLPDDALEVFNNPSLYVWYVNDRIIPARTTVAGLYPANSSPILPLDSDQDGIPDAFETGTLGTNPFVADSHLDSNGNGYLNIEEYLNSLAAN